MSKEIIIDENEYYVTLYEKYKNFLTQTQSQNFYLYYFEDLSYAEIAKISATTRAAAQDSIKKAKIKLKKIHESIDE